MHVHIYINMFMYVYMYSIHSPDYDWRNKKTWTQISVLVSQKLLELVIRDYNFLDWSLDRQESHYVISATILWLLSIVC